MPRSVDESSEMREMRVELEKCNEFSFPTGYKVKICKYCRTSSWAKNPLPITAFATWDPLIPWNQGRRDRPVGFICRICFLVTRVVLINGF
jgi:hypothetical protein